MLFRSGRPTEVRVDPTNYRSQLDFGIFEFTVKMLQKTLPKRGPTVIFDGETIKTDSKPQKNISIEYLSNPKASRAIKEKVFYILVLQ